MSRQDRNEVARAFVAKVGLSGFEERYPHELSGGMRQRVGLARALAVDAEVLLMDEPFSAVDEQTRRKFQEDLLDLIESERKTFIFVTHSIEEAVYVSDQVVLLTPRPGAVSRVIRTGLDRGGSPETLRRDKRYLDMVEEAAEGRQPAPGDETRHLVPGRLAQGVHPVLPGQGLVADLPGTVVVEREGGLAHEGARD